MTTSQHGISPKNKEIHPGLCFVTVAGRDFPLECPWGCVGMRRDHGAAAPATLQVETLENTLAAAVPTLPSLASPSNETKSR